MNPMWITAAAAVLFGSATSFFAFLAYRYTREKFRLDLYERRYAFYIELWKACCQLEHVGLRPDHHDVEAKVKWSEAFATIYPAIAHESHHKAALLFGPDVQTFVHEVFNDAVQLELNGSYEMDAIKDLKLRIQRRTHLLPETFAPYLYFGDLRRFESDGALLVHEARRTLGLVSR